MQLTQALRRALARDPDMIATVSGGRRHTNGQFHDRVARLAGALQGLGAQAGDRVAVLSTNIDRYVEAYMAVPWAGTWAMAAKGCARSGSARRSMIRCAGCRPTTSISTRPTPTTPRRRSATLGAFAELIKAGKVRAIGASNYSAVRLQQALDISARLSLPRYETLQPQFNLLDRAGFEAELQPMCVREEIGVINFFGLARGFLTGKYRSEADLAKGPRGAGVQKACFNERGWRVLAALDAVSARLGATQAQVALAWQMRQPAIGAPIASATSVAQWNELAAAANVVLAAEDIAELARASGG